MFMIFFCADNIPILLGDAIAEFRPLDHIVNQVARYFGNILQGGALFREGFKNILLQHDGVES